MPHVPNDPVLQEVLKSGGFETLLRVRGGKVSAALTASTIMERFGGLSRTGAEYLSKQVERSYLAAQALRSIEPGQKLSIRDLPRVPSAGVVGSKPGDIVFIGQIVSPGTGDEGTDQAVDTALLYGVMPTPDDLHEANIAAGQAIWEYYDSDDMPTPEDIQWASSLFSGAYLIE